MEYLISGVKVKFPFKAYPTQVSMMEKIIKSLGKGENCIIENPTGCGKSLSLLCSSLAWQGAQYANQATDQDSGGECNCPCHNGVNDSSMPSEPSILNETELLMESEECDDEDGDFKTPVKHFSKQKANTKEIPSEKVSLDDSMSDEPFCDNCCCWDKNGVKTRKKQGVPKIFFSSRTHRQLGQLVRELRKTAYKGVKMTILSSRDHTCIHERVSNESNKGDKCKELLENKNCRYYEKVKKFTHSRLCEAGLKEAWDIEELLEFGHKVKGCPYFGARELQESSDIIFCPYNYLIDPLIRESMDISLHGSIVILDEAHNIEDVSRDAVSTTITTGQLSASIENFETIIHSFGDQDSSNHGELKAMCENLLLMIEDNNSALITGDFDTSSKVWSGNEIAAQLECYGLTEEKIRQYKKVFRSIIEAEKEEEERQSNKNNNRRKPKSRDNRYERKMLSSTTVMLESIFMVTHFMFQDERKHMNDYRIALTREFVETHQSTRKREEAFLDMSNGARSIVLTSGTLSPLLSFQSELGLTFHTTLETSHVIGLDQVSVYSISNGPNMVNLLGTYHNSEKWVYQDEVGETLLRVCQVVPHGVLCFFSSYKALEKLCNRWETTQLMSKLKATKDIFIEPKSSNKEEFSTAMSSFYDSVTKASNNGPEDVSGALFLAVCRGKVSEGMDFADNYARAVVLVGIPYPNVKDIQVNLKRSYNDQKAMNGLLPGRDWYEVQAFRALNQALGRCIRHKDDWGAILLVDERFAKNAKKNSSYFSKWVRQRVKFLDNFEQAITDLQRFMKDQTTKKNFLF